MGRWISLQVNSLSQKLVSVDQHLLNARTFVFKNTYHKIDMSLWILKCLLFYKEHITKSLQITEMFLNSFVEIQFT